VDAMDATADWPARVEELRFDPLDPSDPTWHRCERVTLLLLFLNPLVQYKKCGGAALRPTRPQRPYLAQVTGWYIDR
jgi:hypothetical protein